MARKSPKEVAARAIEVARATQQALAMAGMPSTYEYPIVASAIASAIVADAIDSVVNLLDAIEARACVTANCLDYLTDNLAAIGRAPERS